MGLGGEELDFADEGEFWDRSWASWKECREETLETEEGGVGLEGEDEPQAAKLHLKKIK